MDERLPKGGCFFSNYLSIFRREAFVYGLLSYLVVPLEINQRFSIYIFERNFFLYIFFVSDRRR